MNERIKELALQAMTYVTHNPKANKLNSGDMFDEKFAELIVCECVFKFVLIEEHITMDYIVLGQMIVLRG